MNAVSEIEPPIEISGTTPGAMLRREREQRGLTVQQVSEELHLDNWLVEALEENRFLALGAPVYAKGHLRKYAVLLGLPPDVILARYQAIAQPAPLPPPPQEALMAPLPSARRLDWQHLDWRLYGVIGGLMLTAIVATWLISRPPTAADPQVAVKPALPAVTPETEQVAAVVDPVPAAAQPARVQTAPAATTAAVRTPASAAGRQPAVAPPATVQAAPVQQARTAPPNTPTAQPSAASALRTPTTATTPAIAAPAGGQFANAGAAGAGPAATPDPLAIPEEIQVSLRLEFSAASWAEVYDGDGRRLLYAVGDPNRARTISGKPPLKVTLGTAGSVQARVNGRPIAIPRRIGQDSASFTVNANGSIRQPIR